MMLWTYIRVLQTQGSRLDGDINRPSGENEIELSRVLQYLEPTHLYDVMHATCKCSLTLVQPPKQVVGFYGTKF